MNEALSAATEALRNLYSTTPENGALSLASIAQTVLEAANVAALLAERDGLRARVAELELFHRRLIIFAADLHDIASNGYLDDELLAMRGVAALTAGILTKADIKEAYDWLERTAADALKEAE